MWWCGLYMFHTYLIFVFLDGFIGTPSGTMVPALANTTNITTVMTQLTCTGPFNCTNTTVSSNMGCNNYGGDYATVTCQRGM